MAGARQYRALLLVAAALLLAAGLRSRAQSTPPAPSVPAESASASSAQAGSLAGRLTDLHSAPLDGIPILLRNQATGAEERTTTGKNGAYRFTGLEAGQYTLEADSPQLGRGRLEDILVAAGDESRVQSAMQFELPPPAPIHIVFHDIATASTFVSAALPTEPLRSVPLRGRSPELVRDPPPTSTPLMTATLAIEPLRSLPFAGRWQNAAPAAPNLALTAAAAGAVQAAVLLGQLQPNVAAAESLRAGAPAIDPITPVVTTTVSAEQLQALPASGRRWQDFVLDTPTAAATAGGASQSSLRGAGVEPAETAIDGAGTRLAFGGQGLSGPQQNSQAGAGQSSPGENSIAQPWAGGHSLPVAEAAIRQVETVAGNAEAEGSRAAGGRINVETQRGANGLHGQGFIFDRQNTWGAQNPFTQWVKQTAPAGGTSIPVFTPEPYTPPDHETVWGFGAGSQIRRDKLFWFAAIDSYRRNDPGLSTVKHPDVFFAQPSNDSMQVLAARLGLGNNNPVGEGVGAYSNLLETLAGLLGPAPRTAAQWLGFARIDWQAAERQRFTLEGIGAVWNSPGGGLASVSETYGNHSFGSSNASEAWLLARWEAFLTPNLLAVTQGSAGRNILSARPEAPSGFEQTLVQPFWNQLPQIVVDNRYGFTIGNPSRFGQGSYPNERLMQAQESLDWVRGTLLVKAGFEVSNNADATGLLRNQTGTYVYSNVENFASDALVYGAQGLYGSSGLLNPQNPHGCDQTGTVWHDLAGNLRGLGYLPCDSYYSQTMGPANWRLSTNDWAGYASTQWQPRKLIVFSAGMRWEREQLPPPISALLNPDLPLTQKLPSLGNNWGPRFGLAIGNSEGHKVPWPVLRLGYGMYFGRTENSTVETALTQTGSLNGDLSFFVRPTDGFNSFTGTSGAPLFPYVLEGEPLSVVKPGAVEFASSFHTPEVHQATAAVEEALPGHVEVTAAALVSLGRRLPISIDTNLAPLPANSGTITYAVVDGTGAGPIKAPQITVPFYALWPSTTSPTGTAGWQNPGYQQISAIMSRANSTYEAAVLKISRYGRRGLSLYAHYTYAHAMDWNPNESTLVAGSDVLDPANFGLEYGASNFDVRHSAAALVVYETPWKLTNLAGRLANGWMLSGIGNFRSGLPYTMRTSGALAKEFTTSGVTIVGLGPGMNGSGGDNRVYGMGSDGRFYNIGRNTYRYPATWKADLRLGKRFDLGRMRELELMAESFNLFNHQNVTELETTGYYIEPGNLSGGLPTLNFLTGLKANTTAFGQPLNINATNFYRERQIQLGLRMRF